MPHFGLIDEAQLGEIEYARLRALLHLRGGKERLHRGELSSGIASLYDAINYAMRWYTLHPQHRRALGIPDSQEFRKDKETFVFLREVGVLDAIFDFNQFEALVEQVVSHDVASLDTLIVIVQVEHVMTLLGLLPFDEATLPTRNTTA